MKRWYSSKTVWVGILQIAIAILGSVATFIEAGNYTESACILFVSGVLMILLRYMTDTGIG